MVFEYGENECVLGGKYCAPRSNRFYFVHDPNGGNLGQLETYHTLAANHDVTRHIFGGY